MESSMLSGPHGLDATPNKACEALDYPLAQLIRTLVLEVESVKQENHVLNQEVRALKEDRLMQQSAVASLKAEIRNLRSSLDDSRVHLPIEMAKLQRHVESLEKRLVPIEVGVLPMSGLTQDEDALTHAASVSSSGYTTSDMNRWDSFEFLDGDCSHHHRTCSAPPISAVVAKKAETELSEKTLVTLAVSILTEYGTVPVGKMGSLLHRAANNHALPSLLKERYGGLKKFLQSHPDHFVLGTDHPYNPHVTLRAGATGTAPAPTAVTSTTGNNSSSVSPLSASSNSSSSSSSIHSPGGHSPNLSPGAGTRKQMRRPSRDQRDSALGTETRPSLEAVFAPNPATGNLYTPLYFP